MTLNSYTAHIINKVIISKDDGKSSMRLYSTDKLLLQVKLAAIYIIKLAIIYAVCFFLFTCFFLLTLLHNL